MAQPRSAALPRILALYCIRHKPRARVIATKSNAPSQLSVIGIDIGKGVFHLVGFDADGKILIRKKIRRLGLVPTFEKLPRCLVGMEACLSAHFISRTLRELGFEPRIIPAMYVAPFSERPKER